MPNLNRNTRLLIFSVLLSLALFFSFKEPPYSNISNEQLQTMLVDNVPIYDVRRPEEWYQTGIIGGSQLVTYVDADGRVQANFLNRFTADIGKNDPVILKENLERLSRTLTNVITRKVDNCGHVPHEEYPQLTAGLISEFLQTGNSG